MVVPSRLQPGDRLAAVSLSWGGPGTLPRRYEVGKRQLQDEFGVQVVEMPHTLADPGLLDTRPDLRAADLHQALSDPDIDGIVSTIGGEDSIRILPHLDLDLIAAHPKVLLGYSDTTITQMAFLRAGVVSFYGPAVMAGFAENGGMHRYLVDGLRRMVFEPTDRTPWPPNDDGWTVEFADWADPAIQDRPRSLRPPEGPRWHGGEAAEGTTVVGCLEVLDWLRGTEWWPALDGAVLLLETSEEAPPPAAVTRFLRVLATTGELSRLAGLVFGRPGGANLTDEERLAYDAAILRVVRTEAGLEDLPIVTNADFGHTDPIWTIPQGVRLGLDPDRQAMTFLEPAVR